MNYNVSLRMGNASVMSDKIWRVSGNMVLRCTSTSILVCHNYWKRLLNWSLRCYQSTWRQGQQQRLESKTTSHRKQLLRKSNSASTSFGSDVESDTGPIEERLTLHNHCRGISLAKSENRCPMRLPILDPRFSPSWSCSS